MFTKKEVLRRKVAVVIVFVLTFTIIAGTNTTLSKAYEEGDVIASFTYADGVTRYLNYRISGDENQLLGLCLDENLICEDIKIAGFDKYGTVWIIGGDGFGDEKTVLMCLANPFEFSSFRRYNVPKVPYYSSSNESYFYGEVEDLVFDDDGYVVGFKTFDGPTYPTLELEEQNEAISWSGYVTNDYRTYLPDDYVPPTPTPTSTPDVTPTPSPTTEVKTVVAQTTVRNVANKALALATVETAEAKNAEAETTTSTKATVETTEKGYKVYYKGDTVVGKYKLKKNVLTYKGKKYKKVKKVYFIKKSGHIIYVDKNKRAYLVKNKKKKLLLKGVKKVITSGGFAVKVKGKTKTISVKNK